MMFSGRKHPPIRHGQWKKTANLGLVFAITPRPLQARCVATFRSLPSWIASTVDCARIRHSVRAWRQPPGRWWRQRHGRPGHPQASPPVAHQRIHPDPLRRHLCPCVGAPPAPGRHVDMDPVRRPQADPAMRRTDKGLDQQRGNAIAGRIVVGQAAETQAEHRRGQGSAGQTGTDEKPCQSDHPVEMGLPAGRIPADPPVARLQDQGRGCNHATAEPAVIRADQIPQLPPDMKPGPSGCSASSIVPSRRRAVSVSANVTNRPSTGSTRSGTPTGGGTATARPRTARSTPPAGPGRRQRQNARMRKIAKRRQTARVLQIGEGIAKPESRADLADECHASRNGPGRRQRRQCAPSHLREQRAADQILCGHDPVIAGPESQVQRKKAQWAARALPARPWRSAPAAASGRGPDAPQSATCAPPE